jgi:hypothetical protein
MSIGLMFISQLSCERALLRAHAQHQPKRLSAMRLMRDEEMYNSLELDTVYASLEMHSQLRRVNFFQPDILSPNSQPLSRIAFGDGQLPLDKSLERTFDKFHRLKVGYH